MKKILILVEGQTEEQFVKNILNPTFNLKGIFLVPTIITTKVVKSGPNFKGGVNSYISVKKHMKKLLRDSSVMVVTTMIDFYKLPNDFPKWDCNSDSCYKKVFVAEQAFSNDINDIRFIPYLQLHEFEGLLFSSPEEIANTFDSTKKLVLQNIGNKFSSPEEINHGADTHPSKRLLNLFPNYQKPLHGSIIAGRTGLDLIQQACPHFNNWVSELEVSCSSNVHRWLGYKK